MFIGFRDEYNHIKSSEIDIASDSGKQHCFF